MTFQVSSFKSSLYSAETNVPRTDESWCSTFVSCSPSQHQEGRLRVLCTCLSAQSLSPQVNSGCSWFLGFEAINSLLLVVFALLPGQSGKWVTFWSEFFDQAKNELVFSERADEGFEASGDGSCWLSCPDVTVLSWNWGIESCLGFVYLDDNCFTADGELQSCLKCHPTPWESFYSKIDDNFVYSTTRNDQAIIS